MHTRRKRSRRIERREITPGSERAKREEAVEMEFASRVECLVLKCLTANRIATYPSSSSPPSSVCLVIFRYLRRLRILPRSYFRVCAISLYLGRTQLGERTNLRCWLGDGTTDVTLYGSKIRCTLRRSPDSFTRERDTFPSLL